MTAGVLDAGVAIGLLQRRLRSFGRLERLFNSCRHGKLQLSISVVNLAEVLIHTAQVSSSTGVDVVSLLRGYSVEIHYPDEAVARRVAKLKTSLADGFAAATALELGRRLYTTDRELARQLRGVRLAITCY